jgi:type IV secretory pathway VirB2 component (pilin)
MDYFKTFLQTVIDFFTTGIAHGLGVISLIAVIVMYMFGQSGGVFKHVLTVFVAAIALANAEDIFNFLTGGK